MKITQQGFSLFELMISITIIAILTALAIPAYQSYIQKAALTDMLQQSSAYKSAIELCALEQGGLSSCNSNSHGIPATQSSEYIQSITVNAGSMTLQGQSALNGLKVILTATYHVTDGSLSWHKQCQTNPKNTSLEESCNQLFRYQSKTAS